MTDVLTPCGVAEVNRHKLADALASPPIYEFNNCNFSTLSGIYKSDVADCSGWVSYMMASTWSRSGGAFLKVVHTKLGDLGDGCLLVESMGEALAVLWERLKHFVTDETLNFEAYAHLIATVFATSGLQHILLHYFQISSTLVL